MTMLKTSAWLPAASEDIETISPVAQLSSEKSSRFSPRHGTTGRSQIASCVLVVTRSNS